MINGEPVVEVDIRASHLTIVYERMVKGLISPMTLMRSRGFRVLSSRNGSP